MYVQYAFEGLYLMDSASKVARNSGMLLAGKLFSKFFGLFTTVLLARHLGVVDFGSYSVILALSAFFLFANDFGVAFVLVRNLSRDEKDAEKLLGNAFSLKFFLSIFSMLLVVISAFALGYSIDFIIILSAYSFTMISGSLFSIFSSVFQYKQEMQHIVMVEFLYGALTLAVTFAIAYSGGGLWHFIVAYAAITYISLVQGWLYSRKLARIRPLFDLKQWKFLLSIGWPFALSVLFTALYNRVDVVMLSRLVDDAAVGYYSAGFRLTESLSIIPASLIIALFPMMSKYFRDSKESLKKAISLSFRFILVLFVPVAFGTMLLSERILAIFYGAEYANTSAGLSLGILSFAALFIFINMLLINVMNSINREKTALWIILGGVFLNAGLNLFIIPQFGFAGAAATTLITEIGVFSLFRFIIGKDLYKIELGHFIRPAIAAVAMSAFVLYFFPANIFLIVPAAAAIYFALLFIIGGITKDDIALALKLSGMHAK